MPLDPLDFLISSFLRVKTGLGKFNRDFPEKTMKLQLMNEGPGYDVEPNNSTVVKGMNAGRLLYEPMHGGYGAVVALGQNYSLEGRWQP